MISPYRRYTATEIDAANDADLPNLLASLGYQVRRVGSYYTTKEMDSLRIWNRRTWYRYSESIGGDAVAFLRHFHGMSFQEAVRYLLAFNGYSVDSPIPPPRRRPGPSPRRERRIFALPRPHSDNRRVCTYLRGRGIAPGVIDDFIEAGLLYEDREHHNCVFIGRDRTGKPVFAAKRGTGNIPFKCDVAGSDKRIAFRLPCGPALDTVCVFESPIDLMSWITLYGRANALRICTATAMNVTGSTGIFRQKGRPEMQSFTKREIEWTAEAVAGIAKQLAYSGETAEADIVRGLSQLRSEQLQSISERLTAAAANNDKRIAIR